MHTRTRPRHLATMALIGIMGLLVVACSSAAETAQTGPKGTLAGGAATAGVDLSGVKIIYGGQNGGFGPIAQASGAFDDAPYEIEWANLSTAPGVVQGLLAGSVTIGGLGDVSLTLSQANANPAWTAADTPLKNVAFGTPPDAVAKAYPPFQLLTKPGSDITELSDLKGKKIAYVAGGTINKFFLYLLKKANLQQSDVEIVNLDSPTGATALTNGDVDAWIGNIYFTPGPLAAGAKVLASSTDDGIDVGNYVVQTVATKTLDDPKMSAAIGDFLSRFAEYYAWFETHPTEVAAAYQEYLKASPESAALQAKSNPLVFTPINKALYEDEQEAADTLQAGGLGATKVDVSLQYDDRYNDLLAQATVKAQAKYPPAVSTPATSKG